MIKPSQDEYVLTIKKRRETIVCTETDFTRIWNFLVSMKHDQEVLHMRLVKNGQEIRQDRRTSPTTFDVFRYNRKGY